MAQLMLTWRTEMMHMKCPNCGSQLPDWSAFCGNCGNALNAQAAGPVTPPPSGSQGWQQPQPQPQQAYSPQGYAQPQVSPQSQQQGLFAQTATNRAFAMTIYVASLLGVIFALCVRDKDNAFITHHLNNAVVILIGNFIGILLSLVLVGSILMIYLFVMTIMGIVYAYNGEMKELPLIGKIHIVK